MKYSVNFRNGKISIMCDAKEHIYPIGEIMCQTAKKESEAVDCLIEKEDRKYLRREAMQYLLIYFGNYLNASLCAERAAIKRDMVVLSHSPLGVGIILIIGLALLILVLKALFGRFLALAVMLENMLLSLLHIGVYKYLKALVVLLENIVGAATYDNARSL